MLHRGLARAKTRERDPQLVEQTLEVARAQAHSGGGLSAVVFSLLALALSFWSLYETVLKEARPAPHVGAVMYYVRDAEGVEAFAVPITITNQGARGAVITALDLQVSQAKPGAAAAAFASAYVSSGGNLARDRQPFSPLSIAGRGAYAGLVIFQPHDLKSSPQPVVAQGSETYRFCLSARSEGAPSAATRFEAELPWFADRALDASQPIALQIVPAKRDEGRRPQGGETGPACL
jgi:hypothetical protein